MHFVINPYKIMWHWKMSNTELVYSLLGFDTPTSGPTLTFSYLYLLYPTPLPHFSAFHSASPTTNNTHYLHQLTPIQQLSHFTTNAYIYTTCHQFYSSISTCGKNTNHLVLCKSPCFLHYTYCSETYTSLTPTYLPTHTPNF